MAKYDGLPTTNLSGCFLFAIVVLLSGCSLGQEPAATGTPIMHPYQGAPVTVTIDDQNLIIANHTSKPVYHLAFPSELLSVIEWAPCLAPEVCPADQRIGSAAEKRYELRSIAVEGTAEITVFWWRFLDKLPGASVPPMEMDEIRVEMP